jgi:uncharacterized delta-60 repeat protein
VDRPGHPKRNLLAAIVLAALWLTPTAEAAPGDLDPSFSLDGLASTSMEGDFASAEDAILQPDGKLLAVGYHCAPVPCQYRNAFGLARFDVDGSLDPTFGGDGVVATDIDLTGQISSYVSAALQPDGKIVVASGNSGAFVLVRLTVDGFIDEKFGDGGVVRTDIDAVATDIAVQSDGKIVATGIASPEGFDTCYDVALTRYEPDGSLDSSFATNGVRIADFGSCESPHAIALQPDGRIVVAGGAGLDSFLAARFTENGSIDPTFSGDGMTATPFATPDGPAEVDAHALGIDSAGRIVAAGRTALLFVGGHYAVARYLPDGSLDTGFSGDGRILGRFGTRSRASEVRDLALLEDGRIVVAGASRRSFRTSSLLFREDVSVAVLGPGGEPDPAFGQHGSVVANFGRNTYGTGLAVSATGEILIAGSIHDVTLQGSPAAEFAVTRYRMDGGPGDADADGVGNRDDACPKRFGEKHGGCPSSKRTLELTYSKRVHFVDGYLRSAEPGCQRGQEVIVFRKRPGSDDRIRVAQTESDGRYYFDRRLEPGRYYAKAPRIQRRGFGICRRTKSSSIHV